MEINILSSASPSPSPPMTSHSELSTSTHTLSSIVIEPLTVSAQPSSPLPSQQTNSTALKSKKRTRFADEGSDDQNNQPQDHQALSSFITFNHDDPPIKRFKSQVDPIQLDNILSDDRLPNNETLRKGMYLTFIRTAFSERANSKPERYHQLLAQFDPLVSPQSSSNPNPTNISLTMIQNWLSALTSMVSHLDRGHSTLVEKVLSLPWTVLEDEFVNIFCRFVNNLVSAKSEWIHLILEKIVRGFQARSIPLENRSALLPTSVNRRLIYIRLHSLLRSILRLIPTLPSTLWPLLDFHFPKKRENRDGHVCYLSNLLKIASYCPDLSQKIIQLCIEKCLKIDVEIQVEVEEWEDDEGELEEDIFGKPIEDAFDKSWDNDQQSESDLEDDEDDDDVDFDDLSSDEGGLSDDEQQQSGSKAASPQSILKVKKLAAKLDGMLRCMLDHLQQISFGVALKSASTNHVEFDENKKSSDQPIPSSIVQDPQRQFDREAMFDLLLASFESAILRTRRTRHVQFIMFWYASLEPAFADSLLATLVERGLYETNEDNSTPVVTRVAAVSYIASLISRAKYIDKHVTRHVISLLCARLEVGLSQTSTMNVDDHVIWYAIAQAIFYIFCFRWKDLLIEEDDEEDEDNHHEMAVQFARSKRFNDRWLGGLKVLEKAIISPLNPLKACADTVVSQFAKISHQTNFLYCYDIIRRNSNSQSTNGSKRSNQPLVSPSSSVAPSTSSEASSLSSPPGLTSAQLKSSTLSGSVESGSTEPSVANLPSSENTIQRALLESKIDSFFPFDPFKLPLASIYFSSIYRTWEGHPTDEDDDDGEENVE